MARQVPDTLTQTLTVRRPPDTKMLGRIMYRFAGRWMLSQVGWEWANGLCKLTLTWRSDVGQYARMIDPATLVVKAPSKSLKLYDDISRTDRLRLRLLTVESAVRRSLRRDR